MVNIPVYQPSLGAEEARNVMDCLTSTWISSKGKYIPEFENKFAAYVGGQHASAVCNGTVAVHLCLLALGLGAGDEIIVPTLTYIASVNPIVYVGATPVFVDSLRATWQIDPEDVRRKITSKSRAIIVTHLYGYPCDMRAILALAQEFDLLVIEDCAEAIGTTIDGQHVGTFGDIAAFSFFGNKTITTGEGGMVLTKDPSLHDRVQRIKGQGLAKHRIYWHDIIGYNFRMTNICAAIGCAQLDRLPGLLEKKRLLAARYDELLKHLPVEPHRETLAGHRHSFWMYSILVPEGRRDHVVDHLAKQGVETRPVFYPVHTMPMYASRYGRYKVAEEIARRGINLPSWPDLSQELQMRIAVSLKEALS